MNNTVIIHQYTNVCNTVELPPGFADFLRGCMFLYRYSKFYNYKLYVDFSKHPLNSFIMKKHNLELKDENITEYFNMSYQNFESIFNNGKNNYIITNHVIDYPLSDDEKTYMKDLLDFKEEVKNEVDNIKNNLELINYCVIHIRSGDIDCNNDIDIPNKIENMLNNIMNEWGKNILIISDSYNLKRKIVNKYGLKSTDCIPIHLGIVSNYFNYTDPNYKNVAKLSDINDVKATLIEFILMTQSKKIYCFSVYHNSGFSRVVSEIYDIPRDQIQI